MKQDKRDELIVFSLLVFPIIWLGLLIAPYMNEGLFNMIPHLTEALNKPFSITWCSNSFKSIIICLGAYFIGLCIYYSTKRNYRRNEEYGSAKWGNANFVNKKYSSKNKLNDKLFTRNVRMQLDGRKTRRNLNTIIIGGSGAGKTRFYAKPNIMQCNSSFVALDPKGELVESLGGMLEKEGYIVKVLDLIEMEKSHGYNPFHYIKEDKDILKLITNLIRNTTPKGSQTSEPFWEKSETALLQALMLYLYHEAPIEEQNFGVLIEMLAQADVREDDEDHESPLDELFHRLSLRKPNSLACKQYGIYKQAAGVVCFKRLLNQSIGKSLKTYNLNNHERSASNEKKRENHSSLRAFEP